jgi:hypothetical protein
MEYDLHQGIEITGYNIQNQEKLNINFKKTYCFQCFLGRKVLMDYGIFHLQEWVHWQQLKLYL